MFTRIARLIVIVFFLLSCTGMGDSIAVKPNIIIIFTDDQGYADVGVNGILDDVKTPHIDNLANDGVRMTAGYATAPQCSPSRAGLLSGKYQQKIDFENNVDGPMERNVVTIAERLQKIGYKTGMVGKWHLDPNVTSRKWLEKNMPSTGERKPKNIPFELKSPYLPTSQGFDDVWMGNRISYLTTYALDGKDYEQAKSIVNKGFRIDVQSDASLAFIEKNKDEPFFLYLSYFAPHVPLEASQKYLNRFPKDIPNRRRHALAMISAMDDGVGRIVEKLREHDIYDNTIIFFLSDNGAPLDLTMEDKPNIHLATSTWDGSINEPWIGEKGMLSEGGIRIPFIVTCPNLIEASQVYSGPVNTLDVTATSLALAGGDPDKLDGINLIPLLNKKNTKGPDRFLYWRFWNQAAIRDKDWKYLYLSSGDEYLFNMNSSHHEKRNLIDKKPKVASKLKAELESWTNNLPKRGLPANPLNGQEKKWYNHFFGARLN